MNLYEKLRDLLLTFTTLTALLPTNSKSGDKVIRPERMRESDPQSGTLGIVIRIPEETYQNTLDYQGGASDATVVFVVMATTPDLAEPVARALRTNGAAPPAGIEGYAGGVFDSILIEEIRRGYAQTEDGSDSGIYVVELHCKVWYQL
jgi:hypothetical protein